VRALNPNLQVLAPVQQWGMSAAESRAYARAHGIGVPIMESPYSVDANLWGRAVQYGVLDDPWAEAPEEVYTLTKSPRDCPDEPAYVEISFESGVPVAINGVEMPVLDLIGSLSIIAGAHGVGRIDMVENRLAGTKVREIYEAPAAVLLPNAHKELQKMVVTTGVDRFSRAVSLQYADTIYNGLWFAPLREALDAFINKVQERVTGVIRMKLFKGDCRVVGRKSPFALYESAPTHAVGSIS
jgi:argininosuccinate synthase